MDVFVVNVIKDDFYFFMMKVSIIFRYFYSRRLVFVFSMNIFGIELECFPVGLNGSLWSYHPKDLKSTVLIEELVVYPMSLFMNVFSVHYGVFGN